MTLLEENFRSELETQPARDEFDTARSAGAHEPRMNYLPHSENGPTSLSQIHTAMDDATTIPSTGIPMHHFSSEGPKISKFESLQNVRPIIKSEAISRRGNNQENDEEVNSSQFNHEQEVDGMQKYFHDWQNQNSQQIARDQHHRPPASNQQKRVSWEEKEPSGYLPREETPSSYYPYSRDGPRHSTPKSENRNLSSFFQELEQKSSNNHQCRRGNFDSHHQPKSPSEYKIHWFIQTRKSH